MPSTSSAVSRRSASTISPSAFTAGRSPTSRRTSPAGPSSGRSCEPSPCTDLLDLEEGTPGGSLVSPEVAAEGLHRHALADRVLGVEAAPSSSRSRRSRGRPGTTSGCRRRCRGRRAPAAPRGRSGPRSRPAITGIQNDAMISATDPQRSNGGVRQETCSKPPSRSSTFEPSERYSVEPPAGTSNMRLTRSAMRSPSPSSTKPRILPPCSRRAAASWRAPRTRRRAVARASAGAASPDRGLGSTWTTPVMLSAASMPEITAASTQPPSMPFLVQSPASARFSKPLCPDGSRCFDRARGRQHVALAGGDVGAPVLGVEALRRRSPPALVDEHAPSRTTRPAAARAATASAMSFSMKSIAWRLTRAVASSGVSPLTSSSTPQK